MTAWQWFISLTLRNCIFYFWRSRPAQLHCWNLIPKIFCVCIMAVAELSPPQLPKHSQAFIIVLEMNETMELKKSRRPCWWWWWNNSNSNSRFIVNRNIMSKCFYTKVCVMSGFLGWIEENSVSIPIEQRWRDRHGEVTGWYYAVFVEL